MGYLGNTPGDKFLTLEKQVFTTSATDTYVLDREVSSVNDIELFLNNVRQEPTEAYTISGTTLTLASAITSSDSMYCIYQGRAVGTTAPTLPIANFSSTGIDDNADATAITIDSSENVLVGKTTTARTDVGSEMRPNGFIRGTREDGHPFDVVRTNSDGDIMKFYRDAGQVGQITAYTTGISINLGGTGSANALDDYEEGTWTPVYKGDTSDPTCTYDIQSGQYIKIGRQVTAWFQLGTDASGAGGGSLRVGGLPFTPDPSGDYGGILTSEYGFATTGTIARLGNGNANGVRVDDDEGNAVTISILGSGTNDNRLFGTIVYYTA